MDLISIKLEGYKRFYDYGRPDQGRLNTSGKIVAIVGPNEAGKSSILKAIEHLGSSNRFLEHELTRGKNFEDSHVVLEARFLLDDSDRSSLLHLHGEQVRQFKVSKLVDGQRLCEIIPAIQRDLPDYHHFKNIVEGIDEAEWRALGLSDDLSRDLKKLILDSPDNRSFWKSLIRITNELRAVFPSESSDGIVGQLLIHLNSLINMKDLDPNQNAQEILLQRIPQVLIFDAEQRDLKSIYDLSQFSKSPFPIALQNLANLAALNLVELRDCINNKAKSMTLLNKANAHLTSVFGGKWSQSEIRLELGTDQSVLHVFIRSNQGDCTVLDERSDGLRQFVALVSFLEAKKAEQQPILLIDEAETHLHYDAQADLIDILYKQKLASKVIYTTHSVGCLPEDLGTGVRCVMPVINAEKSEIKNWFWQENRPGFSPLLFAIGASSLAFVPIRKAVFVEGATDMLLLPTMFRQVCQTPFLGFQIAPGLSVAAKSDLSLLENEAPKVAFLVDNDAAGKKLINQLQKAGIEESRIFSLCNKDGFVLEDFLDKGLYLRAVNDELQAWNTHAPVISLEDIPDINRPRALEKWCEGKEIKPPDKKHIAYRLLDFATDESQMPLVQEDLKQLLKELYEKIARSLNL